MEHGLAYAGIILFVERMSTDDSIAMVEELRAELRQQRRLNQGLQQQMAKLLNEMAKLQSKKDMKSKKKKAKRGKKTQKKKPDPSSSPEEAPQAPVRDKASVGDPQEKGVPKRNPMPTQLERQVEEYPVSPQSCCSTPKLIQRKPKVIKHLDYIPARVVVRGIVLEQCFCDSCGAEHRAPMPAVAVPTGVLSARMLALIAYNKCAMHLPSVRTAEFLSTLGIELASSTMCNAMSHVSKLLDCIYDRIVARLFSGPLLQLDGTGMKVLQPGETGTHRGQFVVYCNDELTAYDYGADKEAHRFETFLRIGQRDEFRGLVVADSASNMGCLNHENRIRCACWQHARENFKKARISAPIEAEEAIAWIGTFFDVEHEADAAQDCPEQRLHRRKRETRPLMQGFDQWMRATQDKFDPDEDLWKAIQYCYNHKKALRQCLSDGRVPLTNNLAERELGVIGRGRRGYLFAGSDASGDQLAKIYTVVRTCQRMAIAPFEYLAWVLPKLSDLPVNRGKGHLDSLTPWAYRDMTSAVV